MLHYRYPFIKGPSIQGSYSKANEKGEYLIGEQKSLKVTFLNETVFKRYIKNRSISLYTSEDNCLTWGVKISTLAKIKLVLPQFGKLISVPKIFIPQEKIFIYDYDVTPELRNSLGCKPWKFDSKDKYVIHLISEGQPISVDLSKKISKLLIKEYKKNWSKSTTTNCFEDFLERAKLFRLPWKTKPSYSRVLGWY